jgi:hypothetical protein
MAKLTPLHENLVQVDLFTEGVFDPSDVATVKPDGSAWIDRETGRETSFRWQEVTMSDQQETLTGTSPSWPPAVEDR